MRRLHLLLFVWIFLGCCVGAYAQDPGPWFQVLSGSQLPNVTYPGVVTHQGNTGTGWETTVVDLGDGNSGLRMTNPGSGWSCWSMWPEGTNPAPGDPPQNTLAARFRIDSVGNGVRMDLLHVKPHSHGRKNVPIAIGIKDGHLWFLQYACGTVPTDRFFVDLGPVEIGKWNIVYLITISPPIGPPDEPVAICYWNGAKVFDHNFKYELDTLPTYSASECAFGVGIEGGNGPAVVTFDWIADNFYVIDPPAVSTLNDAKVYPDGTSVQLEHLVVTNRLYDDMLGYFSFNAQSYDRASGIRVVSSALVGLGDDITIQGGLATIDGERVIVAGLTEDSVIVNSQGDVPKPIAVTNRSSAGAAFGAQLAVVDDALSNPPVMSNGANNVGLFVTIFGRVTAVESTGLYEGFFYIDDGTGLRDGSGYAGIKCRPAARYCNPCDMPAVGSYVAVTGAMGVRQIEGKNVRYFWTWNWEELESPLAR